MPAPPLCAAPVCAAPTLASAPVSPPAASPCMISQSHTHNGPPCPPLTQMLITLGSEIRVVFRVCGGLPFMAEQQLPVQVLVGGYLSGRTIEPPGMNTLFTTVVYCGKKISHKVMRYINLMGRKYIKNNLHNVGCDSALLKRHGASCVYIMSASTGNKS